jgi:hypothetical protein
MEPETTVKLPGRRKRFASARSPRAIARVWARSQQIQVLYFGVHRPDVVSGLSANPSANAWMNASMFRDARAT